MKMNIPWKGAVLALVLVLPGRASAQNYRIIEESLDSNLHGYTVIHVWGSHEEMGYALGYAQAEEVAESIEDVRSELGTLYPVARALTSSLTWPARGIEEEMDGFVDGVLAVVPDANIDGIDVRAVNALSDLPYLCRSHSAWGRFVEDPVRTLSTRRLDYYTLIDAMHHHLVVAMDPDDGTKWVNFGWASMLATVTGVSEHGTVVALHDFGPANVALSQPVPRSAAARTILTGVGDLPIADHTAWAAEQLADMQVMTDTFIPYFVPEGFGGLFTCESQLCQLLLPQEDFLFGEVIIATNTPTDGHSVPAGGGWLEDYYDEGGPKDLESQWEITGPSYHRVSVEFRDRSDMTIWFDGDTSTGTTERVELEWDALFDRSHIGPDGDADADADADAGADAGYDADVDGTGKPDADGDDAGGASTPDGSGTPEEDGSSGDEPILRPHGAGGGCQCDASAAPTSAVLSTLLSALLR